MYMKWVTVKIILYEGIDLMLHNSEKDLRSWTLKPSLNRLLGHWQNYSIVA